MILIVKRKDYKSMIRKALAFLALVTMFYFYYMYMSNKFQQDNKILEDKLDIKTKELEKHKNTKIKVSRLIYNEAENIVELLGQNKIQSVSIVKNKLLIICDWDTNIEPLFIRYGVLALVKSTPQNIKIAIELKFIVESKYDI